MATVVAHEVDQVDDLLVDDCAIRLRQVDFDHADRLESELQRPDLAAKGNALGRSCGVVASSGTTPANYFVED